MVERMSFTIGLEYTSTMMAYITLLTYTSWEVTLRIFIVCLAIRWAKKANEIWLKSTKLTSTCFRTSFHSATQDRNAQNAHAFHNQVESLHIGGLVLRAK